MQRSDFSKDSPGRLLPTISGQLAFMPDALPPKVEWTDALVSAVSAGDRAHWRRT